MMSTFIIRKLLPTTLFLLTRTKTTSAQYVASRVRDPTFEKLMDQYKNLNKVVQIQQLILSDPLSSASISVEFLNRLSQKLHLNRGATAFLRKYPHIFDIFYHPIKKQPFCRLTETAFNLSNLEGEAIMGCLEVVVERLIRVLSMSVSRSLPLRAVFKVYRELGLPDDFEESVISRNSGVFVLEDGNEVNTHVLKLVKNVNREGMVAAVEDWRVVEYCNEDCDGDSSEFRCGFKLSYPPGMRLKKDFKAKVKEWQRLPYVGPYDEMGVKRTTKAGVKEMEKRAVGMLHEFLSLTVEKMVEVEKISHFRKSFGIDLNIRDLFLDHPGMFYLSTKGKKHTVFLREAYERGRLIEPNPVYVARRKLLDLVLLGRRGMIKGDAYSNSGAKIELENVEGISNEVNQLEYLESDESDKDGMEEVEYD
ncbi:hypothetical protein Leryth_019183 [Lithospermum erythrorhizon]|nr:hypothetical protein Leryth_019183 [Lithospermum erythrorhizon]